MNSVFIYELNDPLTGKTRYIGKTKTPKKRLQIHCLNSSREKNHRANWICSLLAKGLSPIMVVVDEVPDLEWAFWEQEYITLYRLLGIDLVNGNAGGTGGHNPSIEVRQKMSVARKGKRFSAQHCARISAAQSGERGNNFGKVASDATRRKISLSGRGKIRSAESRLKLSAAKMGEKNPNFGKPLSDECKAKISLATSGERNHMFGKPRSAEVRAKISATKRRHNYGP